MKILAICGSIRETSSNRALIQAIGRLLPMTWKYSYFQINELPFFDPDLQFSDKIPDSVKKFS
jgi:NAD(P)H-dependent FMN reductase